MTRINAKIKPADLIDQHLLAEYREIVRIPNTVKANLDNAYKKVKQAPQTFKLGTGHVIYFYDKIKFLHERFLLLKEELQSREIETNMTDEMFYDIPVDCGKIIVRERDWDEIEALEAAGLEFAFYDVVDGKQRLTALNEFINDVFPDSYGNYYSDLSDHAQHAFGDNQLISYAEMKPHTKDADVIKTFLRMNFSGIPQSKEHLDYLKSIKM